jgi:transcriptional antiterminator RfaH
VIIEPSSTQESLDQNNPPVADEAAWYVAYTQPKSEKIAVENLDRQGFETYCPQYKVFKKTPVGPVGAMEVMFPRYVFFKPRDARLSISAARSTRGVSFVLSFGTTPALLKNSEFLALQKFEEAQNQTDLATLSPFQPNRKVRLLDKSLNGLEGLVQSVSGKRVFVLLQLLGRENLVSVDHNQIQLV